MLLPQVGTVIFGRYRLRREIARGGMSSVWEAEDRKLRRAVAVKILLSTAAKSRPSAARFEREAMAVAQLQSPHIVQIFDYGVDGECPFIVMELLEGEDLRARLRRVRRMSLADLGPIVVQTAKGLGVAHAAGLVHRDLKPGNIFLVRSRDEELVKLLDFGVAKAMAGSELEQETTKDGAILGTPRYMSPEQALGARAVDHRSDLWSFAVILFRALTGRPPFAGKTPGDVVVRVCTQPPPRATEVAPDLPASFDAFFDRALRREPDERYQSAREFVQALFALSSIPVPSLWPPAASIPPAPLPTAVVRASVRPVSTPPRPPPHRPVVVPSAARSAAQPPTDPDVGNPLVARDGDDAATVAMDAELLLGRPPVDDTPELFVEAEPDDEADAAPVGPDEMPTLLEEHPFAEDAAAAPAGPRAAALDPRDEPPFVLPLHRRTRGWVWLIAAGVTLGALVALLARRAPSVAEGGSGVPVTAGDAVSAATPVAHHPPATPTSSPTEAPVDERADAASSAGAERSADRTARPADERSGATSSSPRASAAASATASVEPSAPATTAAPVRPAVPPSPGDPFADRL